jgi:tetratricopeptide (TPR) repeat protein
MPRAGGPARRVFRQPCSIAAAVALSGVALVAAAVGQDSRRISTPPDGTTPSPRAFTDALERYARGDHDAARALDCRYLIAGDVITSAGAWIQSAEAERASHSLTAAAFATEVAWWCTQTREYDDRRATDPARSRHSDALKAGLFSPLGVGPVIAWAVATMPEEAPPLVAQAWWPATMGVLQKAAHWRQVLASVTRARAQAPGPRWRLVETLARTDGYVAPPASVPGARFDVLRADARPPSPGDASRAIREFDALRDDPTLSAEADVRAGLLHVRRRAWDEALRRFELAVGTTSDPFLIATAHYLSGWSYERLKQSDQAIAAYQRALAIEPAMRNVATLLATQLFLSDRRDDAYPILARALDARTAPPDLLATLERGDARFVPGYLDAMRRALR